MSDPLDVLVGMRIRLRRKMRGMTQEALARQLGISFQQIQKYEKGANRVSSSRMQMLSAALGVPVTYFFGETVAADGIMEEYAELRTECIDFAQSFLRIRDPATRYSILTLIECLADADRSHATR